MVIFWEELKLFLGGGGSNTFIGLEVGLLNTLSNPPKNLGIMGLSVDMMLR